MMNAFLPNVSRRDAIEAEHTRSIVAELRRLGNFTVSSEPGAPTLRLQPTAVGINLHLAAKGDRSFLAKIMSEGPGDPPEDDYTDARYWIKECYSSDNSGDTDDGIILSEMTCAATDHGRYTTAVNLAEEAAGTHKVIAGTFVHVFAIRDSQAPAVVRCFFSHAAVLWTELTDKATISTGATSYVKEYNAANVLIGEKRYLHRLANPPVSYQQLIGIQGTLGTVSARASWGNDDTPCGSIQGDIEYYLITEDFDTGTVNWANQPATQNAFIAPVAVQATATGLEDPATGARCIQASAYGSVHGEVYPNGIGAAAAIYGVEVIVDYLAGTGFDRYLAFGLSTPIVHVMFSP